MKKILFVVLFLTCFSTQAMCAEETYCGQIVKFEAQPVGQSQIKLALMFKELPTDEEIGYTQRLPKKINTFKVKNGNFNDRNYLQFIGSIISNMHDFGMCITVNKKTNTVVNIVAGG